MPDDLKRIPRVPKETESNHRSEFLFKAQLVGLGILIGIVLSSFVGYGLFITGSFDRDRATRALPAVTEICPTAAVPSPVCPTCTPMDTPDSKVMSTPTATFTATPDFAATATAACASHISRFPGTPCPPFATATP